MPIITMPDVPELGLPNETKEAGQRVDFRPDQFDLAIETKGYLLLWERAALCPCAPVTTQTEQPDPNCSLCDGKGYIYFGGNQVQDLTGYIFTDLQNKMVQDNEGMLIRGIITSVVSQRNPVDVTGNWVTGSSNLTVRYQNKIGYYDKITSLDAQIVYSEIVTTDGTNSLPTRYPVVAINQVRSVDKLYRIGVDFHIDAGQFVWLPGYIPATDIRLALHYLCHPVWLVVEHPHAARVTSRKFKTTSPQTPTGDARQLPIQALVRYEFLQQ